MDLDNCQHEEDREAICRICGDDLGYLSHACEDCGNDVEEFCPACMVIEHLLDFHALGLHGEPTKFWQGLADYCLAMRDMELHISKDEE